MCVGMLHTHIYSYWGEWKVQLKLPSSLPKSTFYTSRKYTSKATLWKKYQVKYILNLFLFLYLRERELCPNSVCPP